MEQRQAVTWWTRSHPPEAKDDPERVLGVVQGSSGLHVCLCQVEQDPAAATRVAWERGFCSSTLQIALLLPTLGLYVLS